MIEEIKAITDFKKYVKNGAFPQKYDIEEGHPVYNLGLTKREYFVGQTIIGLLPFWWKDKSEMETHEFVEIAIEIADEALKQLNESQP